MAPLGRSDSNMLQVAKYARGLHHIEIWGFLLEIRNHLSMAGVQATGFFFTSTSKCL